MAGTLVSALHSEDRGQGRFCKSKNHGVSKGVGVDIFSIFQTSYKMLY